MIRTYAVTLGRGVDRYLYVVEVDDELAAQQQAVLEARVRAAAEYHARPHEFALWLVKEVDAT